ncbi:hypothetical protein SynBIOSE41_03096 [Synechococcus sp. BIOS-E4-1]|nr:hypothetical protein SynBIOSE41_03096 [Synechococcus sp. BIOS-E4-1]
MIQNESKAKGRISPAFITLLTRTTLVDLCLGSGRWVSAQPSDKLVLVVGSLEVLIGAGLNL